MADNALIMNQNFILLKRLKEEKNTINVLSLRNLISKPIL